ncbi:M10 family metallopeptidase [Microvirga pudoricolor]|uniref:M10 family metallopeptidase n=1 Tax=Microvirga pudoricolor TaxID=2778729 RepID=UPI001951DF5D|nr:M10 family metallopeptidase [Microvirga pudoricolor]MBM6596149.1 M10 family metallopeptidase C-terminal domain-containing protein [Microvirga pudoricolor]
MCYACAAQGTVASWASFDHASGTAATTQTAPMAASGSTVGATGIRNIDALLSGYRWSGTISYSFPDARSDYESKYMEANATGFGSVTFAQMQAARYILEGVSPYAGGPMMALTSFEGVTGASIVDAGMGGADIRIAKSGAANPTAYAYYPGSHYTAGDVWFGTQQDYGKSVVGSYAYMTMVHELGHALGLKHGHVGGGVADVALTAADDSMEMSVMTYRSYAGQSTNNYTNEAYGYAQTFMIWDIAALQEMYGANFDTRSDSTLYHWDPATGQAFVNGVGQGAPGTNRIFQTIWDGGGIDTYDFSNYGTNLTIDLSPGGWSTLSSVQLAKLGPSQYARGNVFNALQHEGDPRSLIENAKGSIGNDTLTGNAANNALFGGGGNDTLFGAAGDDSLTGGAGDDQLNGGSGTDTAFFTGARSDYTIAQIDEVTFQVTDHNLARDGSDRLIDINVAQFSDQTFVFGSQSVPLAEAALGARILKGSPRKDVLVGSAFSEIIQGLGGNDTLRGNAGNDYIVGNGGKDILFGGGGQDTFVFNTKPSASNIDTIKDFSVLDDTIHLDKRIFTKLGAAGALKKAAFHMGPEARDKADRVIYDKKSGGLFYDPDGSGSAQAKQVAILSKNLKLTHKDFWVV